MGSQGGLLAGLTGRLGELERLIRRASLVPWGRVQSRLLFRLHAIAGRLIRLQPGPCGGGSRAGFRRRLRRKNPRKVAHLFHQAEQLQALQARRQAGRIHRPQA